MAKAKVGTVRKGWKKIKAGTGKSTWAKCKTKKAHKSVSCGKKRGKRKSRK